MAVSRPNRGLGIGQTWQDVTASRVLGTTYTNTTGKPIAVSVRTSNNSSTSTITVDGVVACYRWGGDSFAPIITLFAIVQPGSTYVVASNGGAVTWVELR